MDLSIPPQILRVGVWQVDEPRLCPLSLPGVRINRTPEAQPFSSWLITAREGGGWRGRGVES